MDETNLTRQASSVIYFEWQVQDGCGVWITYGGPEAPTVASDDIEKYYLTDSERLPLFIESRFGQFQLNFQNMTETNKKTLFQRPIRRIPKQNHLGNIRLEKVELTNKEFSPNGVTGLAFRGGFLSDGIIKSSPRDRLFGPSADNFGVHAASGASASACGGGNSRIPPKRGNPNSKLKADFVWQFEDDSGSWITYGKTNLALQRVSATVDTSDDIEDYHSRFPDQPILITRSKRHEYKINFQTMTQTNMNTNVCRRIRRIPKKRAEKDVMKKLTNGIANISVGEAIGQDLRTRFVWQFKDERGAWTPYGQPNSAGYVAAATYTTSQDIEKYFSENPSKPWMRIKSKCNMYELNFQNMTQTNLRTKVQRPIRRIERVV